MFSRFMQPPGSGNRPPAGRGLRGAVLLAALIAAGMAGNYFKFTMFISADFVFGSIFAMLALQLFGLGRGILAALLISLPLLFVWGHPYSIVILTAETAAVGLCNRNRPFGYLQADALFWICLGMPLVYLTYHLVMGISTSMALFFMAKSMTNGLVNVLAARLILVAYAVRSRRSRISQKETLYILLAVFVMVPTLVLLAAGSRRDYGLADGRVRSALVHESRRTTEIMANWVQNRSHTVTALADLAAARTPGQMRASLEQAVHSDRNFLRIAVQDRNAAITACFPPGDQVLQESMVPVLNRTLKPMLSDVVLARVGAPRPVVAMAAPVLEGGRYAGRVTGILDLEQIQATLNRHLDENAAIFILLDRNGTVVMTNCPDLTVMAPLPRGLGTSTPLGDGISQWLPAMPAHTPATERWGHSSYVAESTVGELAEWKLILEQPVAPFQKVLFKRYSKALALVLALLLVSLAVAEIMSRQMTGALAQLNDFTRDLPHKLTEQGAAPPWPASHIHETNQLIYNFKLMADALCGQFNQVRQANESLERKVQERTLDLEQRTAQLTQTSHDLNFILDHAPFGLLRVIERRHVFANRQIEKILQYSKGEMEGMSARALYASDEIYEQQGLESYPALAHGLVFEKVLDMVRKDGTAIPVRCLGKAVDPKDPSLGSIWLLEDITEQRRAEQERRRLDERMDKVQKLEGLGVLTAGLAHNLNNVLAIAMGTASLRQQLASDPADLEAYGSIVRVCMRGRDVVRSLIHFAQPTLASRAPFDLHALIQDLCGLLENGSRNRLKITMALAPEPVWLDGDSGSIRHALMNLALNALEAMPDGGTLVFRTLVPGPDRVELLVEDSGAGMTPEILAHALEPFYTTRETGQGLGLGLSVAYGVIKAHGGTIDIASQPGEGTRVRMGFPRIPRPEPSVPADPAMPALGAMRVFLVDDDEDVRFLMTRMLKKAGVRQVKAFPGGEAVLLELRREGSPDLVILDQNMPRMSGLQTLEEIRALPSDVPILISSGQPGIEAWDCFRQPRVGVIPKPFNMEEIQAKMGQFALDL
ncbi:MAG: response regulator [Holophaga sp.]|nr:response regulator [Holophaga sp.]